MEAYGCELEQEQQQQRPEDLRRKGRHEVVTAKLACFPRFPACRTAVLLTGPSEVKLH